MRHRGFTLLEMMVASAIAGIVLAAAVTVSVTIQRSFVSQRELTSLHERAKLLEEYFVPFFRQVGQRSVRPWEAVLSTCPAASSSCVDRPVHLLDLQDAVHLTLTTTWDGTPQRVFIADGGDGTCPLTAANGYPAEPITVVMLPASTTAPDGSFRPGWKDMRCSPRVSDCSCELSSPPGVDLSVSTAAALPSSAWGRARLVRGQTFSILRDVARQELIFMRDLNGDGSRESVRLADEVFGFSVSCGIRDDDTGEVLFSRLQDATRPTALRMLRLELGVGTTVDVADAGKALVTDGGTIAGQAGVFLQRARATVSLPTAVGL